MSTRSVITHRQSGRESWLPGAVMLVGLLTACGQGSDQQTGSENSPDNPAQDSTPPVVAITDPTTGPSYDTGSASVTIAASATDETGLSQIAWTNDAGGSGSATVTGTLADASFNVALQSGANVITLTAQDTSGNLAQQQLTVNYTLPAAGSGIPDLPQVSIDTAYTPPTGNTIPVNQGESFQTALNNAQPGDTIVLQAGATFTGPFSLPNKTSGSGWIYIRSSAYASLPAAGVRVTPSDAANMATLTATGDSVIAAASNAHHYRFVGIEFKPTSGSFVYNLISIGNDETSASLLPNNITFDRCYIHGDPSVGGRRGIAMEGNAIAVVDSHVSDFKESGADSQALWSHNGQGPYKIVNNYLEAAGENVLFGGATPAIANSLPADIEIRRNHFFKPLSWIGSAWTVKNLLELKLGKRVLIEGNVFENNWAAAQSGFSILLTPRNEDGSATWAAVQDVTIRLNKGINLGSGINISGEDDVHASQRTRRVLIENNVLDVTGVNGADSRIFQILHGPADITVRHNTAFASGGAYFVTESSPMADKFIFQDNIVSFGNYGFMGTGTVDGLETLNTYYTNYTFTKNAIIGGDPFAGHYTGLGCFFPASTTVVEFVDYGGGDYRLASTSPYNDAGTDGTDLGADIDALAAVLTGV